jgi:hypothetical protein
MRLRRSVVKDLHRPSKSANLPQLLGHLRYTALMEMARLAWLAHLALQPVLVVRKEKRLLVGQEPAAIQRPNVRR